MRHTILKCLKKKECGSVKYLHSEGSEVNPMLITQFAESPTLLHSQDGNNIYKVFGNVILNPKSIKYCKQTFDSITFRVFPIKGHQFYSMQKFYFDIGFFLRLLYVVHIFLPGASGVWTAL